MLSCNMWGVPFVESNKKERFKEFSKQVIEQNTHDIYCFQEVFSERRGFLLKWIPYILVGILYCIAWVCDKTSLPTVAQKLKQAGRWIVNYIVTGADLIEGKIWSIFALLLYPIHWDSPKNPFFWNDHYDKWHFIRACEKVWGKAYFARSNLSFWPTKFVDSGLLIVSRFPLRKIGEVVYQNLMDEDKLATKGALFAVMEITTPSGGTEKIAICTTHLQSGYGQGPRMTIRQREIAHIASSFKAFTTKDGVPLSDYHCIIAGDFNICCYRDEKEYCVMMTELNSNFAPRDLKDVAAMFQPGCCTEGDRRVDYILTNLWCESCHVIDFHLSDHKATEAILCVPR